MTAHAVDREVVELLADEPRLLAIADAVSATQRTQRRRSRAHLAFAAVVAAALVALIAAVVSHEPAEGSLVPKALAAVGRGPVLHAELAAPLAGTTVITLATGRVRRPLITEDYYYDAERGLLRTVSRRDGVVVVDGIQADASPTPLTLEGFITGYRRALATGRARRSGEGTVAGRRVIWLTAGSERVAVDAQTFAPAAVIPLDPEGRPGRYEWRVVSIQSIPRSAADFRTRQPTGGPFRGDVTGSEPVSSDQVRETTRWPAVWLGERWQGMRLVALDRQTITRGYSTHAVESSGLRLRYERLGGGYVELLETGKPEPAYGFAALGDRPPAEGELELSAYLGAWSGKLRTRGAFVALSCSSRPACIAAARALKPIGAAS